MNVLPDYIKGERVQLRRSLSSHASAVWQYVKDNQDFFMKSVNHFCDTAVFAIVDEDNATRLEKNRSSIV